MLFSLPLLLKLASANDGLHLLQTAAHHRMHTSVKWVPGTGTVLEKCGEGGDLTGDLAGWTGGDFGHAVGNVKIDSAPTKEGCIANVLKDPRCQDKKAEIDLARAADPTFSQTLTASYAPGQGKCYCAWGSVESHAKDPTVAGGWITCLAKKEKTKKTLDDKVDPPNAQRPILELKKRHPKFGPDGTWATPYCKSLLGCTPYCPNGCNGVALWQASIRSPGLGNADKDDYDASNPGAHFLTCIQGQTHEVARPPNGDNIKMYSHGLLQCLGSENSTKKSFWSKSLMTTARKDELGIAWGTNDDGVTKEWNSGGAHGDGPGWGNQFCPAGCVNDCAEFKYGSFLACGMSAGSGWAGYDSGTTNAVGPNRLCPQNAVSVISSQMAYTWCGEPKVETPEDFVCDLCAESVNEFDPTGKKGKCGRINQKAQKSVKGCERRKSKPGVIKRCCPAPPVDCPLCPDGKEFKPENLDGKCAVHASRASKNQQACDKIKSRKRSQRQCCVAPPVECPLCPEGTELKPDNLNGKCADFARRAAKNQKMCDRVKGRKRPQQRCCVAPEEVSKKELKTYTPDDFALTKTNECPEGTEPVDYKTCHDQAANYQWPGQPAGHTQRWDEEDHDPEFGEGWLFMPPGCVLYTGWTSGSHTAQVRWNPNQDGKNDGLRAKVCEKAV